MTTTGRTPVAPSVLFWRQVTKTETCWNWNGWTNPDGYARFAVRTGRNQPQRKVMAYRWAYEETHGPIPDGMELDHLCYNPLCVNPDHLEPVTGEENMRRRTVRSQSRTHCRHGHEATPENVKYDNSGKRVCRPCHRESVNRHNRKRRAA